MRENYFFGGKNGNTTHLQSCLIITKLKCFRLKNIDVR